jgi:hypothetical protein
MEGAQAHAGVGTGGAVVNFKDNIFSNINARHENTSIIKLLNKSH